jgi:PPM family protein phosphatase
MVNPDLKGSCLAIVADGMGGHQAGEKASEMAIDVIGWHLGSKVHGGMTEEERETAIREAIVAANEAIFSFASTDESYKGMGTTVVVALASGTVVTVAHVGDSRAYAMTSKGLNLITSDHSLVNELMKSGQITPEEAEKHPRRNVVTRALGTEPYVQADFHRFHWTAGDQLLMCSDGLSGMVPKKEIQAILTSAEEPERKADLLVQAALTAGGEDNVTVALLCNETGNS